MTEAGRQPWYNGEGHPIPPYIVGVAGGSASGKTSIAKEILRQLPNVSWVAIVTQDAFYKPLSEADTRLAFEQNYDFDHPNAIDQDLLIQCVRDLKQSRAVQIPVYSFTQHQRTNDTTYLYGQSVIVVEGLFVLQNRELVDLLDLKIFVQTDPDVMLARRIRRDIVERGRSMDGVLEQYFRFVKPSFDTFVGPSARAADIIVPGANNQVAIDVIAQHMSKQLTRTYSCQLSQYTPQQNLGKERASDRLVRLVLGLSSNGNPVHAVEREPFSQPPNPRNTEIPYCLEEIRGIVPLPPNVFIVPQTAQLVGLLTTLHDVKTGSGEFAYACKRVGAHVVEHAMSLLPYRECEVPLHTGGSCKGVELDIEHLCGISILRSGAILEAPLRRSFPALPLGSLLIQSNNSNYRPLLYSVRLPSFVRERSTAQSTYVFLTDAQIGTGAAAFMAIRVLLDHGVPQEQILLLTILTSAEGGVWALHHAFPGVRIVTGGLDPGLEEYVLPDPQQPSSETSPLSSAGKSPDLDPRQLPAQRRIFAISPGCGQMGDRYWGT
ncbi:uridine/cytidine kinase [Malassezia yamatoensis]|uniref:Uridine kinase n=1 Tax=Malassezia yamatoensis TaxID=253288 RepID=A0AAJ5YY21_9BASI|nr:uridine/cytidine kinase [Malassezia yamatoensis]